MKKLNLGAGTSVIDGYEARDGAKGDCLFPLPDVDCSVDEIRASHVLEHFGHGEVVHVLRDWARVLKPGGKLKIAVPDLRKISELYVAGTNVNVQGYLMGGQTDALDFHKCLFDRDILTTYMDAAGFSNIENWTSEIQDCASLPISLNLSGIKEAAGIRQSREDPGVMLQQGLAALQAGQVEEALAYFEKLLAAYPEHVAAHNNRGIALARLRRYQEALASFDRALALNPELPELLRNKGSALAESGDRASALAVYRKAVQESPDFMDAWLGLGLLLQDLGRDDEALACLDRVLAREPTHILALKKRAYVLKSMQRYEAAGGAFQRLLSVEAASASVLNDFGAVLVHLRRNHEALAYLEEAIALEPDFAEALSNMGLVLCKLLRFEESLSYFERALRVKPDFVSALDNRAVALAKLGRFDEAIAGSEEALKIDPEFVNAHIGQGITRLRLGDFERGLRSYEWRWVDKVSGRPWKDFSQPLWMGRESLEGKTILIHAEQGLGDTLQFARYASMLGKMGARVWLAVPGVLTSTMKSLEGVEKILALGESVPATDFHCPLLSLPLALGTTLETIPARVPYLFVDAQRAKEARLRLARGSDQLVGICWRGNPSYRDDHERSIPFEAFRPLLSIGGVQFISLQKEVIEEELRATKGAPFVHPEVDFDGTCEVVAAMDLIISVDTCWAHFAGALGKPLWLLLSPVPHWVWLTGRDDSPWYPSARLFRQERSGDWASVMRAVCSALSDKVRPARRAKA